MPGLLAGLMALACARPVLAEPVPDIPEGHWTGRVECMRAVVICADLPVVVVIGPQAADHTYPATLTYVAGGTEYPGPALVFALNPDLHTLTAHYTDFADHQFWVLRLQDDAMSGLRMVNTRFMDRSIYLTRDKQP